MKYIPALDGLRAIAVLTVFMYHARVPLFWGGYVGVDVFFVLSGYLITRSLLEDLSGGKASLSHFYARRFFRLMPALLLMLLIYGLLAPHVWQDLTPRQHLDDMGLTALYLSDYAYAFWNRPAYLLHSWSLAVEEHYYLVWPLLLLWLARRRKKTLPAIVLSLYLAATLWRFFCITQGQGWDKIYYRFDTHCSGLLLGGFLAAFLAAGFQVNIRKGWLWGLGVLSGVCLIAFPYQNLFGLSIGIMTVECTAFAVIAAIVTAPEHVLNKALSHPVLTYIGRISYGVYLFHFPVIIYVRVFHAWPMTVLIGLAVSVALAIFSYHVIERPVLGWAKKRFGHPNAMPL